MSDTTLIYALIGGLIGVGIWIIERLNAYGKALGYIDEILEKHTKMICAFKEIALAAYENEPLDVAKVEKILKEVEEGK